MSIVLTSCYFHHTNRIQQKENGVQCVFSEYDDPKRVEYQITNGLYSTVQMLEIVAYEVMP